MKLSLLRDIYNIVAPDVPGTVPDSCKSILGYSPTNPFPNEHGSKSNDVNLGGFYVLYDEAAEQALPEQTSKDTRGSSYTPSHNTVANDDDDERVGRRKGSTFGVRSNSNAGWR